tara:strand:+ start:1071 stop:2024 length:954 start_codon:yes stop_codon:yes gene_type:complete
MEFLKAFFSDPVSVAMEYPVETLIYFILYLVLYMIIRDQIYRYINRLHTVLKNSSLIVYDRSKKVFSDATSAWTVGVKRELPIDFGTDKTIAKSRYVAAVLFTCILIPINIWMLGTFLDIFEPLRTRVFPNSELLYGIKSSHVVALAIVVVETFMGWGYYVSEKNAYTFFKWFCLIFFGGLWFVETYTWYTLSDQVTGISVINNPVEGTFWEKFFDGFLLLTGAALTFFEFLLGYFSAQYREQFGSLHIMATLSRVGSYFQSLAYFIASLIIFLLSASMYILSYVLVVARWIIQLVMILAKFIFTKLGFEKDKNESL